MQTRQLQSRICLLVILFNDVLKIHAQIPELSRKFIKTGFHRDIENVLALPASLLPDFGNDVDCFMLFTETIPSGAYVDPYQLISLKSHGGPDAVVLGPVDIEKPEFAASPLLVHIYANLSLDGDSLYSSYSLPVHLRYHAVSAVSEYVSLTLGNPEIAVRCVSSKLGMVYHGYHGNIKNEKREMCSSYSRILCDWLVIQYHSNNEDLSVTLPVGRKEHLYTVVIVTVLITLAGCFILLYKTMTFDPKRKIS